MEGMTTTTAAMMLEEANLAKDEEFSAHGLQKTHKSLAFFIS
jgi:hypothetical protein